MRIGESVYPLNQEQMRRVIEGRGAAPRVPLLLHQWISAQAFGERAPVAQAILDQYRCDAQVIPWCNVRFDVQRIIPFGTPEEVRAEVRHLLDTFRRPDGRFMFAFGNGVTPDTPIASIEALFDEASLYSLSNR